jgi:acyl-CoA reductase-like NAD-dependent aldehyde dehydrogenase
LQSFDPATLEIVGSVPIAGAEEVAGAVVIASEAQERWRRTGPEERRRRFETLLEVILDRADEIAGTITSETGKPLVEAYTAELYVAAEHARWLARNASNVLEPRRLRPPRLVAFKRAYVLREPLGTVAIVSPWNFPFAIPFTQAAAVVSVANAAVIKPSELAPLSGDWVRRVFEEAGFPEGLVAVVHGAAETGALLVEADGIAKVLFTGSAETGRAVATASGSLLRPVTLELGGKDPMLVFADSDRERALAGALWGSFTNCGQVCAGAERIYVETGIFDEFVSALAERARSLRIGSGRDADTELGPLISESQRERVEALVDDAVERGAEPVAGARRAEVGLPGWFYEPTVLVGSRLDGRVADEELFGPVVTVEPFASEEEGTRLANGSAYGLGASVWTRDSARARRVARALQAGSVWVNDIAYSYYVPAAPWGGAKSSGYGRTHGVEGLLELVSTKYVDEDSGRVPVPWWFPYGRKTLDGLVGSLDLLYRNGLRRRARTAARHRAGLIHLGRRYARR